VNKGRNENTGNGRNDGGKTFNVRDRRELRRKFSWGGERIRERREEGGRVVTGGEGGGGTVTR